MLEVATVSITFSPMTLGLPNTQKTSAQHAPLRNGKLDRFECGNHVPIICQLRNEIPDKLYGNHMPIIGQRQAAYDGCEWEQTTEEVCDVADAAEWAEGELRPQAAELSATLEQQAIGTNRTSP